MPTIKFEERGYESLGGETVLDCLLRHGKPIAHSCKSGICQSCVVRALKGPVPPNAQKGLKDTLRAGGAFLACSCVPTDDMDVAPIDAEGLCTRGRIHSLHRLNESVMCVRVEVESPLEYRPGQFLNLRRADGLVRSYSIASIPGGDGVLEFHVALMPGGAMSTWMHESATSGTPLDLLGPVGNCFYIGGTPEQSLFLLGTGTGLAPLYGIVRDALAQGHTGQIRLFHGSVIRRGLYLVDELRDLANLYENFHYHPCVLDGNGAIDVQVGAIDSYSLQTVGGLKGWRVFLCGNPDMVRLMQKKAFLAGASLNEIYADAFVSAPR